MKTKDNFAGLKKELNILVNKYGDKFQFVGSVILWADNGEEIIDDNVFAYGDKKYIEIDLKEMLKEFKKEKGEFVNW